MNATKVARSLTVLGAKSKASSRRTPGNGSRKSASRGKSIIVTAVVPPKRITVLGSGGNIKSVGAKRGRSGKKAGDEGKDRKKKGKKRK